MRPPLQGFFALQLLWLLLVSACAPVGVDTLRADVARAAGHLVEGVDFIPQEEYQCGPAALAMVLRYYGAPADPDEIAGALHVPSLRGTLNLDLEFHARRLGFQTQAFEGTLGRVKAELARGRPLLVFQDLGPALGGAPLVSVPHFAVLLGYDDEAGVVVLHSGTTPHRVLSYAEFERTWALKRRWTLLITPPAGAPPK